MKNLILVIALVVITIQGFYNSMRMTSIESKLRDLTKVSESHDDCIRNLTEAGKLQAKSIESLLYIVKAKQ